jgi:hypothetical protein
MGARSLALGFLESVYAEKAQIGLFPRTLISGDPKKPTPGDGGPSGAGFRALWLGLSDR